MCGIALSGRRGRFCNCETPDRRQAWPQHAAESLRCSILQRTAIERHDPWGEAARLLCRHVAGVADVLVDVFFTRFAFGFRLHFTYTHVA